MSQAASVAILPSALFLSDFRSVHIGRTRFIKCCYLIINLDSRRLRAGADSGARYLRAHQRPDGATKGTIISILEINLDEASSSFESHFHLGCNSHLVTSLTCRR